MWSFIAGTSSMQDSSPREDHADSRSSAWPVAARARKSAVAGATTIAVALRANLIWSSARPGFQRGPCARAGQ